MKEKFNVDKEEISIEIERIARTTKMTFMEATIEFFDENGFDLEDAGKIIAGPLIEKIRIEAQELSLVKQKPKPKIKFLVT